MTEKLMLLTVVVAAAVLAMAAQMRAGGGSSSAPAASKEKPQGPVGHHAEIPKGFSVIGSGPKAGAKLQTATVGAGCFWGVESTFRAIDGVVATAVGYSGGTTAAPSYKDVCTDATGHAEVVELVFDANVVSYEQLLKVFWENHNPTTLNRQGPDEGTQYRSVIFYHDDEQRTKAEASKKEVGSSGKWKGRTIVTQIVPAQTFYIAEDYHQRYLEKRGMTKCHN